MTTKLLLVNSDEDFVENFIYSFKSEDYTITAANGVKEGIDKFANNDYDLVILDMVYRDGTGLDLKKMMNEIKDIPTIMVSSIDEIREKILALEYGCDDYIVVPFDLLELKARMRAVLRRSKTSVEAPVVKDANTNSFTKDLFEFNILGRKVTINGTELDLTGKEFDLLYILVSNKSKVFTRQDLADELWQGIDESNIRTVDVHIRRLREKLESTETDRYIQTRWGEGYYYDDNVDVK